MPRGSYIKAFLTTSVTVTTGNDGTSAMNVPLMAAAMNMRGAAAGIQIWSVEFEFSNGTWYITDNTSLVMALSQVTWTAEKYVNDRDVIVKIKLHFENAANGTIAQPQVLDRDFYPAIPFYGQQLHLGVRNDTGVTQTVYCKVWYSSVMMSQTEILQQLQNQLT